MQAAQHISSLFFVCALLVLSLFLAPLRISRAQAVPSTPISPPSVPAAPQTGIPDTWNDAVKTLAGEIAAAVKPSRAISLNVKNISSLSAEEVGVIRKALETELATQGLQIRSGEAELRVTLSENAESYVWVAESRRGDDQRTVVVRVEKSREPKRNAAKQSVVLYRDLIWQQSQPIMDFFVPDVSPDGEPLMFVLEQRQIITYHFERGSWRASAIFQISVPEHRPRDLRGLIDFVADTFSFQLSDARCDGDAKRHPEFTCNKDAWAAWPVNAGGEKRGGMNMVQGRNYFDGDLAVYGDAKFTVPPFFSIAVVNRRDGMDWADWILAELDGKSRSYDNSSKAVASYAGWGDGIVSIPTGCGVDPTVLVSGTGDWTERDYLRAYRTDFASPAAISDPLEFPGPIMALWPSLDGRAARVTSKNLQTGMYEASIVTISCSQ